MTARSPSTTTHGRRETARNSHSCLIDRHQPDGANRKTKSLDWWALADHAFHHAGQLLSLAGQAMEIVLPMSPLEQFFALEIESRTPPGGERTRRDSRSRSSNPSPEPQYGPIVLRANDARDEASLGGGNVGEGVLASDSGAGVEDVLQNVVSRQQSIGGLTSGLRINGKR